MLTGDKLWSVEFSVTRNRFHYAPLEKTLARNRESIIKGVSLDWRVIAICDSLYECEIVVRHFDLDLTEAHRFV